MSEFHGGFLIERLDAGIAPRILEAVRHYLAECRLDPANHHVTFAWRRGCPVIHVAVRGGEADGKGYCYFHQEHAGLGGWISASLGARVWAYSYENQAGSESVSEFDPSGRNLSAAYVTWDDLGDDDERPLARLARDLGVAERLLEIELAYDTPACGLRLDAPDAEGALAQFLEKMPLSGGPMREQTFYFDASLLSDARKISETLDLSVDHAMAVAWEIGKTELFTTAQPPSREDEEPPSTPLSVLPKCPPVVLPPELLIPDIAPEPAPLEASERCRVSLVFSERALEELRVLALHADRSPSWCLARAYGVARARLSAARRRD